MLIVYSALICCIYVSLLTLANNNLSDSDSTFYSYDALNVEGHEVPLKLYKGKVSLIVNVASYCGFTDGHYRDLVRMQDRLGSTGKFIILAFPCNQFGQQEPKSINEIYEDMKTKYSVNFPIFAKIDVLGSRVPKAWKYLIEMSGEKPDWNFWKYLVDEEGHVLNAWGPTVAVSEVYPEVFQAVQRIAPDSLPRQLDEL